jgi:hypothetical protein
VQGAPPFTRVRVKAQAYPLTDFLRSTVTQEFRVENVALHPPVNRASPPTIVGEIVNAAERPAVDVRVAAAIYDSRGALHQVASTMVKVLEIAPGQSAPFEIRPVGRSLQEIPGYELFVEGRPKN